VKNLYSDTAARAMVKHYAAQGVNEDVALRVYTSRLLGGEPALAQHGGGNTSVKTAARDPIGEDVAVICVKDNPRYPYKPNWPLTVLVNPEVTPTTRPWPAAAITGSAPARTFR